MGNCLYLLNCSDFRDVNPLRRPALHAIPSLVRGLPNSDNRCYANSALQCLTRLKPIEFLYESTPLIDHRNSQISEMMYRFYCSQQMNCPDQRVVRGIIEGMGFGLGEAHDSFEFLSLLLSDLQTSSCEPNISSLFQSRLMTLRYCQFCEFPMETAQTCSSFGLNTREKARKVELVELLETFFSTESDHGLVTCSACGQPLGAMQSMYMQSPPRILVLHLRSMQIQRTAPSPYYPKTYVNYPITGLNLSRFTDCPAVYNLAAVIAYDRSHYTCQVHRPDFDLWLLCDDEVVTEVKTCRPVQGAYVLMYTLV